MNINPDNENKTKRKTPRPPKKISERYLHNSGLYYLQRFTASSAHFRSVMMRKVKKSCYYHKDQNYDECALMVDALVEKFQTLQLLDDEAYTKGLITSLRRSGKSRRAVLNKLKIKGLPTEMVAKTLEAYDSETSDNPQDAERHAALIFAKKKRLGPFTRQKETPHAKALASMARAGFSYDTCRYVLDMDPQEAQQKAML